ncbi:hypothetical protein Tco_0977274 [Tanacetum coccineum]|uniref:Reverse transcriptase Ty1/copia-type domain-containing protein n=1 Tax=Tanacetum coccineum TaxID=301880 RepID=A0ABQ5EKR2_9ASTR
MGQRTASKAEGGWIFISQDKYVTEILKKFGFTDVKTASTPMETQKPLLKDEDGEEVDVHLYRSMIGSLMYLTSSRPDIMFAVCACCKKQTMVANSTTEAEYVAASSCLDGKNIIITEETVRRDLQLEDADGVDCLPNATIFEQLTLMGKQKSRKPKEKDTQVPQSSVPSDPTNIAYEAINEEPSMHLKELMDFYTKLQQRVLDLENTKTDGDEMVVESEVTDKAGEKINIVEGAVAVTDAVTIPVSGATITNVELTLAQTLAELKSARPNTKGVVMQDPSESTPTIYLQLPSQVKGQVSKDKGKAKMIEPEKPLKKKDQIMFDEEEALRLQAKFDEEDRLAREKAQQVEEANIAWDDIQAKIDVDYQLAKRLQAQEQQELTIEEITKIILVDETQGRYGDEDMFMLQR